MDCGSSAQMQFQRSSCRGNTFLRPD
jgi:hypothetical protein